MEHPFTLKGNIMPASLIRLAPWSSFDNKTELETISQGYDLDELYIEQFEEGFPDDPVTSTMSDQRIVDAEEGYFWCLGRNPNLTVVPKTTSPRVPISVLIDDKGNKWILEQEYYRLF